MVVTSLIDLVMILPFSGIPAGCTKTLTTDEKFLQILRTVFQILLENLLLFQLLLLLGRFLDNVLLVDADFDQRRGFLEVLMRGHATDHLLAVGKVLLAVRPDQFPILADGGRAVLPFFAFSAILPLR